MSERQVLNPAIPETVADRCAHGWRSAGLLFCVLMIGVHAAVGFNSAGVPDSWRDMYWATMIAHAEQFPAFGPPIYRLFELGPWWFYLLAIPIALTGKTVAAAVFVQVLASTKYLLAWRLGTREVDARFGFLFAACLAVAGWSTAPALFPTHTALVETTLLLLAMATLRSWRQLTPFNAMLFGIAAAACVHAHPTTVFHIGCAGIALLFRHRSWAAFALLAFAGAIVIASLLPPLFDSASIATSAQKPVVAYLGGDIGINALQRVPALLRSLTLDGAWLGLLLMTKWSSASARVAWWLYAGCLVFAATGVLRLRGPAQRKLQLVFVGALAAFAADVGFLALVRPITPIWMISTALPPLALATAVGWHGWLSAERAAIRWPSVAAFGLFVGLSLAPFGLFLRPLQSVRVMPGVNPYLDIIFKSPDHHLSVPVPFIAARELDRLGAQLCAPAVLHGRLAAAIENSLGSTVRNACGHWPTLRYGGVEGAGTHLAGVLANRADALGIEPARVIAGIALYDRVRPIAPVEGGRPTRLARMQVDPDAPSGASAPVAHDFTTNAGDVVLLTSRLALAAPMSARSVTADGRPARVVYDDGGSWGYACAACAPDAPVRWHVQYDGIENAMDLVVLLR